MCGRFSLTIAESQTILRRFGLKKIAVGLKPRYNIAPSQQIAVILNESSDSLTEATWGLIPHWAKDETSAYKMINARAESINEKPAYKEPFQHKRCLVISDSYYEWNKESKKPYRIMMKDEGLFSFVGIWDRWDDKTTCSIITTTPNELMKKIHIRMPVILPKEEEKRWLSDIKPEEALTMLKPFDASQMKAYEISPLVNSVKNESPDVIKPLAKTGLGKFFS
jgi:putative SOS response-associated peptidase YedK